MRATAAAAAVLVTGCLGTGGGKQVANVPPARVVDGHNDVLSRFLRDGELVHPGTIDFVSMPDAQTDLARWREGGVAASFVTVVSLDSADPAAGIAAPVRFFRHLAARYAPRLVVARSAADVRRAARAGQVALLLAVEGAEQLGRDSVTILRTLDTAHALGIRSVGLTWNHTNAVADAALDSSRHGGLTPLGARMIDRMNELGLLVDLSHASEAAALGALARSRAPVIFSHSSAAALVPTPRNVSDSVLRRVAANGGVVMVTFVPYFTTRAYAGWYEAGEREWTRLARAHGAASDSARAAMTAWESANPPPRVTVADVADHVEHVRRVAGVDHVGIGSDFDGMFSHVEGLEGAAAFPVLLEELRRRGWSEADVHRVAGGNVLRVIEEVERRRSD